MEALFLLSPSFQFWMGGNTVTSATNTITLSIGNNSGSGTLTVTANPLNAIAGVATFSGSIDKMELAIPLCNFCRIIFSVDNIFNVTVFASSGIFYTTGKWDRWQ